MNTMRPVVIECIVAVEGLNASAETRVSCYDRTHDRSTQRIEKFGNSAGGLRAESFTNTPPARVVLEGDAVDEAKAAAARHGRRGSGDQTARAAERGRES
jgi:hypothetical protein